MSEYDTIFLTCPYCAESHKKLVPKRSIAHYVSMNNVKTSYIYRCHFDKCPHCVANAIEKNEKFLADDLAKILKELTLLDKKNGEWLSPKVRTRSDCVVRPQHFAITPTFPDKNPCMTKYKMEKLLKKITTLDPDSQIESHFEIGGDSGDGIYHYHIHAYTKMGYNAQNNKTLSNIIGSRIDIKVLKDSASIGKWKNYIKKDLDKFQDKRLEFPSYNINL